MFESDEERATRRENCRTEAIYLTTSLYTSLIRAGVQPADALRLAKDTFQNVSTFAQNFAEKEVP